MHEGTVSRRSVLSAAAGLLATTVVARAEALPGDAADAPAGVARDSRRIHGWQVFVSQALLATEGVTRPGSVQKVAGEGMPIFDTSRRGALFVTYSIDFPASLTEEQKATVRSLFGGDKAAAAAA